ncbi:hypothetical protein F4810DRAFT_709310 [Camillea tinctor]|nr:hypothetical protein F4810DRAFT_709310 [Camillea tinctor]
MSEKYREDLGIIMTIMAIHYSSFIFADVYVCMSMAGCLDMVNLVVPGQDKVTGWKRTRQSGPALGDFGVAPGIARNATLKFLQRKITIKKGGDGARQPHP